MPGVTPNPEAWLKAQLNSMQAQITALATSQQAYVLDHNSVQRVLMGWQQAFNTYGIAISDSSGNPRVMIGELPDGNHGVAIYDQDNDGGYVELNPPVSANWNSTTLSTTSTTDTTLANSPSLAVSVGHSGKCLVMVSAILGNTAGDGCVMSAYTDGVLTGPKISLQSPSAVQSTAANNLVIGSLSQGGHTLTLEYRSISGATANFSNISITAIPY